MKFRILIVEGITLVYELFYHGSSYSELRQHISIYALTSPTLNKKSLIQAQMLNTSIDNVTSTVSVIEDSVTQILFTDMKKGQGYTKNLISELLNHLIESDNLDLYLESATDSRFETLPVIIFVLDSDGKIYSATQKIFEFHHSSFLAGADVVAAGEFKFIDGILEIRAKSGHYVPDVSSLSKIVEELVLRGVDIRSIKINRTF